MGFYNENPGLPCWSFSYGHTADFYFSGHTGNGLMVLIEVNSMLKGKWRYLMIPMTLWYIHVVSCMLYTRSHYTADIFTGFLFASWLYLMYDHVFGKYVEAAKDAT